MDGLAFVLAWEGGYANDPMDHGGSTNRGITQRTYDKWLATKHLPAADVRFLSNDEACDIYKDFYWNRINGDRVAALCPNLAVIALDSAVQHGPRWAGVTLQRVVGAEVDGEIGPATMMATKLALLEKGAPVLLENYLLRRKAYYVSIINNDPTQNRFKSGWRRRLNALCESVGLSPVWVTT